MSSSSRRAVFALILPLLLAACGFQPVYAPGGPGAALRGRVIVEAPETEAGYLLLRNIEDRLGRANDPGYRLTLTPVISSEGQGVTAAGEITRFSIVGRAGYVLRDGATDAVIASGKVENFTGYSATGSAVETLAAESDATERLMVILADQILAQIFATADLPG